MVKNIAIFASGTGTNAKKIIEYFSGRTDIKVNFVVSNKEAAPVLNMAQSFGIETLIINRAYFYKSEDILQELNQKGIDFIVLAGFLWLIPDYLVNAYTNQMINIHPALLPKYGGKGMYGMNVHRAVKLAGEKESGISIHYVNAKYDEGNIIFQAACSLDESDSPETIAQKVRTLEHQHFAPIIESLITRR
ncbi:MAG: phosphoribosylglycinamide formyltransferase [Saprospiraceae bacterium]|nr:phosphoribosylglycinamide formyltransferase [Saprospiraceae bacterium]